MGTCTRMGTYLWAGQYCTQLVWSICPHFPHSVIYVRLPITSAMASNCNGSITGCVNTRNVLIPSWETSKQLWKRRLVIPFVDINYHMVGNFHEGFIFVFFTSQEPFAKIKTAKISLSTCEVNEPHFNTAANRSVSASVPLTAIAEAIQKIEMLAT